MRNKTMFFAISLIFVMSFVLGCDDQEFLNQLPRGTVIAKTTNDFRQLLDHADNSRYTYSLTKGAYGVDLISDDCCVDSTTFNSWTGVNMYLQNLYVGKEDVWNDYDYTVTNDDMNWKMHYYVISLVGTILQEIKKANDDPRLQKQLIAEARFHRVYAYFNVVNLYCKHYDETTAATDMGVPMYDISALLPSLERRSVKDVYDFMISELTACYADLPVDNGRYKHRPTQTATDALLARIYLYMGDYINAKIHADNALKNKNYLYDFNADDFATGNKYYNTISGISITNDEEMILNKVSYASLNAIMKLDTASFNALYTDYSFNNADSVYTDYDLRRRFYFDAYVTSGANLGRITKKVTSFVFTGPTYRYKTDGTKVGSTQYKLPLATPEMYLTRAECNVRAGALQEALNDVNTIRRKRHSADNYTDLTLAQFDNNKDKVLERVLLERRRELYGRELRLYDIKRLQLSVVKKLISPSTKIDIPPRIIRFPANDPRLIWPIFRIYIEVGGDEIIQNDRSQSGVTIN